MCHLPALQHSHDDTTKPENTLSSFWVQLVSRMILSMRKTYIKLICFWFEDSVNQDKSQWVV